MEDIIKIIIVLTIVIGPLIAGSIKKAADKKAKEKLDDARRRYGNQNTNPNIQRNNSYTQYGMQQEQAPPTPRIQYKPQPTPMPVIFAPPPRKIVLDEEARARAAQEQYRQYAPREVSHEHAQPSFDMQFKGDVAIGKVGETQLVSNAFKTGPEKIAISSFDTQEESVAPPKAAPRTSGEARELLGSFKGSALKRAILMKEILGPPKALEI